MLDLCFSPNDRLESWDNDANVQKGGDPDGHGRNPLAFDEGDRPGRQGGDLLRGGVRECWIFDRQEESVRVYRFAEDPEQPVTLKSFDERLTTPLLPEFSLEMWRIRESLAPGRKRSMSSQIFRASSSLLSSEAASIWSEDQIATGTRGGGATAAS